MSLKQSLVKLQSNKLESVAKETQPYRASVEPNKGLADVESTAYPRNNGTIPSYLTLTPLTDELLMIASIYAV
jgi:hypothetical protein